ncbi:toxin-antitoxin system HicB family antitoxin [Frateuria sp. MAH-13]|uniref:Toxin-antitoxin system HicB family antitoxin n=1 Tax=Frateuria flava TaxID=2821489 RepID=A0ABS4DI22_9GAMM|nr:toxin-antitoxin system HicB family antitoxin [Frateuria flava]MBP1472697.1 toxin-antitoxin system HicB family antitoxin [Frateuria flava]
MPAEKKAYPLRISASVLEAMQRWSDDELRSVNAQIEYVLREALRKSGRLKAGATRPVTDDEPDTDTR